MIVGGPHRRPGWTAEHAARSAMVAIIERERSSIRLRQCARIADGTGGLLREHAEGSLWGDTLSAGNLAAKPRHRGARDAGHSVDQRTRRPVPE